MAVQIRNQHRLVTMDLKYRPSRSQAVVVCRLWHGDEKLEEVQVSAPEIGIHPELNVRNYRYAQFQFPDDVLQHCVKMAQSRLTDGSEPVWLQVEQSTGYLAVVPWERLLAPAFDVPLLRIPNFVVDPVYVRGRPEFVLCISSPRAKTEFYVPDYADKLVQAIYAAVPTGAVIHVFADAAAFDDLNHRLQQTPDAFEVVIHDPEGALPFGEGATDRRLSHRQGPVGNLDSPWLLWMQDALRGRQVDGVHFVCPGFFARDRGALALARSPSRNTDPNWSHFVGIDEITALLDLLGAWTVAFSPPHENVWSIGLRLLADELAWRRPGPLLMHDSSSGAYEHLSQAYRFLFGREPCPPPDSPAIMLYCHPKRLPMFADPQSSFLTGSADPEQDAARRTRQQMPQLMARPGRQESSDAPAEPAWKSANRRLLDSVLARLEDQSQNQAEGTIQAVQMLSSLFGVSEGQEDGP